jgi:hypothetical protein
VLAVTIEGVRRNLAHPVGTVWVVTVPESKSARVAAERGCRIVDEGGMLPIGPDDIDYHFGSLVRSRWLFQQLLKLSADTISSRVHVLVIDADTVLVRSLTFTSRGKIVLFHSLEYHQPYFDAYCAATGRAPAIRVSCTTHHLLLRRSRLVRLKSLMEHTRSVPWWQVVLDTCMYEAISGFAESELYGNYDLTVGGVARRWWSNQAMPRTLLADLDALEHEYGSRFALCRSIATSEDRCDLQLSFRPRSDRRALGEAPRAGPGGFRAGRASTPLTRRPAGEMRRSRSLSGSSAGPFRRCE